MQFMGNLAVSKLIYDLQKYFLCGCCTGSSEKLVNPIMPCKTDVNKLDIPQLVSNSIDGQAYAKF